ncbi:hypothetical protein GGQ80_001223 [Sphingomonas jinjuensis]|uniref:Uncharacterized protein n=1 Tax=Sphingomonas jinjuensis TaxID=535907 RepID=A0A840F9P4_9SPHN|nr:hypothetical protein [Sphingomonas jinjuensis]
MAFDAKRPLGAASPMVTLLKVADVLYAPLMLSASG